MNNHMPQKSEVFKVMQMIAKIFVGDDEYNKPYW